MQENTKSRREESQGMNLLPSVVPRADWEAAREKFLAKEKEATRQHDLLAAERRRQPMYRIDGDYAFGSLNGTVGLADIFEGRSQLIIYHFMFGLGWKEGCTGCSMMVDNMPHPAHLNARDVTLAIVAEAPLSETEPFRKRMGWTHPWYSSHGSDFNRDFGVVTTDVSGFGVSVLLNAGSDIYRTYFTERRGLEQLGSNFSYLDLVPYGRQETWEDSPEGWPQSEPYQWWRHHDRY